MKWWNSNIGVCATHATVFAQLILDGYRHTAYYICLGIIKYLHCVVCMFFFRVTDSFSVLFLNAVATFFSLTNSCRRKEYGVHVFMLQVRDEDHALLPGIEAGDVGPKMGDHAIDTGADWF